MTQAIQFSPAEQKVVEQLLQRKSNKQIALALHIAESTVEFHLHNIYTKIGVTSRIEAIKQLEKTIDSPRMTPRVEQPRESIVVGPAESSYDETKQKSTGPAFGNRFLLYLILIVASIGLVFFLSSLVGTLKVRAWSYEREAENPDESTVGQALPRTNASGSEVHGQFGTIPAWPAQPGFVRYNNIEIPKTDTLYLKLRYSKYSTSSVLILIFLDNETIPRASLLPKDQGDWNRFTWTEPILLGKVESGIHSIMFYTEGQVYGVADLDKLLLTAAPP